MFRHRHCALIVLCLSMLSCLVSGAAQSPSVEAPKTSAKIWVGRYREIEEYLKTAECVSIERLPPSALHSPAGWTCGPDGVAGVASGDPPWFLHEL